MSILNFIFQDGWHFIGAVVLIYVVAECIEGVVGAVRRALK